MLYKPGIMSPTRATIVVTFFAALSRILGFVRDVLLTQFLGAGPAADAFLAAFRLPNALRRIAGEGGFNPAFVPFYLKLRTEDRAAAKKFARQVCIAWGGILVLATILAELAAGFIMAILAGGLEGEAFALSVLYFRLLFPLILGSGLAALLSAVLNAEKRVIATSIAPLACNLTIVAAVVASQLSHLDPARSGGWIALAAGVSGFLHLVMIALALRDTGLLRGMFPPRLGHLRKSTDLSHFSRFALPVLAAIGTAQLFPVAAAQVASHMPSAVSWFYYADRLFQLPAGFIAAASGIVLLPQIARHHARNDRRTSVLAQNRALESALLFSLPAAAALSYLALPIVTVLFERGAFLEQDSLQTAMMVFILSLALPFSVMAKIFSSAVFALGRIRTAIATGVAGLAVTWLISWISAGLLGAPGVAIGATTGITTYFLLLALSLWAAGLWYPDMRLFMRAVRTGVATTIMMLVLVALGHFIDPQTVTGLTAHCLGGLIVYAAAAWLCGAVSRRDIRRYLRR